MTQFLAGNLFFHAFSLIFRWNIFPAGNGVLRVSNLECKNSKFYWNAYFSLLIYFGPQTCTISFRLPIGSTKIHAFLVDLKPSIKALFPCFTGAPLLFFFHFWIPFGSSYYSRNSPKVRIAPNSVPLPACTYPSLLFPFAGGFCPSPPPSLPLCAH